MIVGLGTQTIFLQVTSVFREIPKFYIPLPPRPDLPIFKFRSITSALNTGIILTPEAKVLKSSLAVDIF